MDKKSKIFFIILGLLITGSILTTYYRTMISKNYITEAQADCDPYAQKCFIWECDPQSNVEGEKCTGDPEKDIWYYSLVERNSSKIPLCDPNDENCKALECSENETDCSYIYCDDETKIAQEAQCSDPVEYTKNNPPEEEDVSSDDATCEEGDTECEATITNEECAPDDTECQSATTGDDKTSNNSDSSAGQE
jgi:hypothetical protein